MSSSNDFTNFDDSRVIRVNGWKNWAEYEHLQGYLNQHRKRPLQQFTPYWYPRNVDTQFGHEFSKDLVNPKNNKQNGEDFAILGQVPELSQRYTYTESSFGLINEHSVAVAESSASGSNLNGTQFGNPVCTQLNQRQIENNCSILGVQDIGRLILERSKTAIEGVHVFGDMVEEQGQQSSPNAGFPHGITSKINGDVQVITDPENAWVINVTPADATGMNAVWVAQRIPDGHFFVAPNVFTIREVDLEDKSNFLYSNNLLSSASAWGAWKEGDVFDFCKIFSAGEQSNRQYSGRRVWRAFSLANPEMKFSDNQDEIITDRPYPFSIPVSEKLSPDFLKTTIMRDSFEGTPQDLTVGLAAGPFKNPTRYSGVEAGASIQGQWERPFASFRSIQTCVAVCDPTNPQIWISFNQQVNSFYSLIPVSAAPHAVFQNMSPFVFDLQSITWVSKLMNTLSWQRQEGFQPEIKQMQQTVENQQYALFQKGDRESLEKLSALQPLLVNLWRNFAKQLSFKQTDGQQYNCKVRIQELMKPAWNLRCENPEELQNVANLGYDEDWLVMPEVGYLHDDIGHADLDILKV